MKLSVLTKLRTRLWRRREAAYRQLAREPHDVLNLNRPTLRGRIATLEEVHGEVTRIIKGVHDRYHDRKGRVVR